MHDPSKVLLTITSEGQVILGPGLVMDEAAETFLRSCSAYVKRLEAENRALREDGEAMTTAVFRLMAAMEIDNHQAQMDAYLDAQEPFQQWREVLYAEPVEQRLSEEG